MSFSAYKRRVFIGWMRDLEEEGRPMPGERAIATRMDFGSLMLAADLVDELIAEKLIAIVDEAGVRRPRVLVPAGTMISSSPSSVPPHLRGAPPITEEVVKEYRGVASGTARKAPSGDGLPSPRRRTVRAPIKAPAELNAPPAAPELVSHAHAPEAASPKPAEAADASPQRVEGPHATVCERKPIVSAEIVAAARDRGQPLDQFVTALLNIGFAEWRVANKAGLVLA